MYYEREIEEKITHYLDSPGKKGQVMLILP